MASPRERQIALDPYSIVRVACRYCPRRGRYRIERLVTIYGRDTTLEQLLKSQVGPSSQLPRSSPKP